MKRLFVMMTVVLSLLLGVSSVSAEMLPVGDSVLLGEDDLFTTDEEKEIKELAEKYEPVFKDALEGQATYFFELCKEYEVDYDLALAVSAFETGYFKSYAALVQNNFGGMMGGNGLLTFSSVETGLEAYIKMLGGYAARGACTFEAMAGAYAPGNTEWAGKARVYLAEILSRVAD